MVEGWTRVCPDCGNGDGAKVERVAFHPTFQCECGHIWDGSSATFIPVWYVEGDATDDELDALADVIAARMNAVAERAEDRPIARRTVVVIEFDETQYRSTSSGNESRGYFRRARSVRMF